MLEPGNHGLLYVQKKPKRIGLDADYAEPTVLPMSNLYLSYVIE